MDVYLLLKLLLHVGVDYIDLLNCRYSLCKVGHHCKAGCKRNRTWLSGLLTFGLRFTRRSTQCAGGLDYKLPMPVSA